MNESSSDLIHLKKHIQMILEEEEMLTWLKNLLGLPECQNCKKLKSQLLESKRIIDNEYETKIHELNQMLSEKISEIQQYQKYYESEVIPKIKGLENLISQKEHEITRYKKDSLELRDKLNNKKAEFQTQIAEKDDLIMKYKHEISILKHDYIHLKQTLDQSISDFKHQINEKEHLIERSQQEITFLSQRFSKEQELFNQYNSLSFETKESLNGIFKGNTLEEFVYCGVQEESILSLWEYTKKMALEGKDIYVLKKIVYHFLQAYNVNYNQALYVLLDDAVGTEFDNEKHIRVSMGNVSGLITTEYLKGYKNSNTNRIIKKSVVKI